MILSPFRVAQDAKRQNVNQAQKKTRVAVAAVKAAYEAAEPESPVAVKLEVAHKELVGSDLFMQEFQAWDDMTTKYAGDAPESTKVAVTDDPEQSHPVQQQARANFGRTVKIVNAIDKVTKRPGGGGAGLPLAGAGGFGTIAMAVLAYFRNRRAKAAGAEASKRRDQASAGVRAIQALKKRFCNKDGDPDDNFRRITKDPALCAAYEEEVKNGGIK